MFLFAFLCKFAFPAFYFVQTKLYLHDLRLMFSLLFFLRIIISKNIYIFERFDFLVCLLVCKLLCMFLVLPYLFLSPASFRLTAINRYSCLSKKQSKIKFAILRIRFCSLFLNHTLMTFAWSWLSYGATIFVLQTLRAIFVFLIPSFCLCMVSIYDRLDFLMFFCCCLYTLK